MILRFFNKNKSKDTIFLITILHFGRPWTLQEHIINMYIGALIEKHPIYITRS